MNNYNLRYHLIDICTPDCLSDHHNREGEQLIAVEYYGSIDYRGLASDVAFEVLAGCGYDELWKTLPSDDETAAQLIEQLVIDETSGASLDFDGDDDGTAMIYGYFSWDT